MKVKCGKWIIMSSLLRGNHDWIFSGENVLLLPPLDVHARISRLLFAPVKNVGKSVCVIVAGQVKHREVEEIRQILAVLVFSEVLDDRSVVPGVQEGFQLTRFWAQRVDGQ